MKKEQRCWVHKIANVLDKLPKRLQPRAKMMLHEIMRSPTEADSQEELDRFVQEFEARYPKATTCLLDDQERMLTFYDFPAEHWSHLRTTNPIESAFATVKARTRKTKGAGSRKAGLALTFKLTLVAEKRWRRSTLPTSWHQCGQVSSSRMDYRSGLNQVTLSQITRWIHQRGLLPDMANPQHLTISRWDSKLCLAHS